MSSEQDQPVTTDTAAEPDADATPAPDISNYTVERGPRRLTQTEVDGQPTSESDRDDHVEYFAVKREDGIVGGKADSYDGNPKIRVLYTTEDGRRSYILWHRAQIVDDQDQFAFADDVTFHATLSKPPKHGRDTSPSSIREYRDLVDELHGGDGE